jgi:hypothetical protein
LAQSPSVNVTSRDVKGVPSCQVTFWRNRRV